MAKTEILESSAISAFCDSIAVMLAAGIQTEEAVSMLSNSAENTPFRSICEEVYAGLANHFSLSESMAQTGAFPPFAVNTVNDGEKRGKLEASLRSLSIYYDEEHRLFSKIRSSIGYPAALLIIMCIILAFTIFTIIPVFIEVYESISGSLTSGSFSFIGVAVGVGYTAFVITAILAVIAIILAIMSRNESGRMKIMKMMEKIPFTKKAMYELALSRFCSTSASFIASGSNTNEAVENALKNVDNKELTDKLEHVYQDMIDLSTPMSFSDAMSKHHVFLDPVYARMLSIGTRTGSIDTVLERLSTTFFNESISKMDKTIDSIEPVLAAFLTIAVGATLISVMIPLVGIMSSIA